jgi:hypothetical protein
MNVRTRGSGFNRRISERMLVDGCPKNRLSLGEEIERGMRVPFSQTTNEFVARVPAVYLGSAEVSILALLPDCRINNLRRLNGPSGFEPRPAHHLKYLMLPVPNECSDPNHFYPRTLVSNPRTSQSWQ